MTKPRFLTEWEIDDFSLNVADLYEDFDDDDDDGFYVDDEKATWADYVARAEVSMGKMARDIARQKARKTETHGRRF